MRGWLTGNAPPANEYVCRCVHIPNEIGLISAVSGALYELTRVHNWEQFGTLTPEETAQLMVTMLSEYLDSNCMLGTIQSYITTLPPPNCLICDGTIYDKVDYPTLYDLLDPVYIISGTQFQTPDLRGQFLLGESGSHAIATTGGTETVVLTENQLATHTHIADPHKHIYNYPTLNLDFETVGVPDLFASGNPPIPSDTSLETVTLQTAGSDEAHPNMPPFTVVRYCIVAR